MTAELGKALIRRGDELTKESNYGDAQEIYHIALSVCERINNKPGIADAFQHIGLTDQLLANFEEALKLYNNALSIYKQLADKTAIGKTLMSIGRLYKQQGKQTDALSTIQMALSEFEAVGDKPNMIEALNLMGSIYLDREEPGLAAKELDRSIQIDSSTGNTRSAGNAFYLSGYYSQAAEYFRRALAEFENQRDLINYEDTLGRLADTYAKARDYDMALEYHLRSLKIGQQFGNKTALAAGYMGLANTYFLQGNLGQAADSYLRSLELDQQLGNKLGAGIRLANLGVVRDLQGDSVQALEYYRKSLAQLDNANAPTAAGRVYSHVGDIYYRQTNYDQALTAYQKSLELNQGENNKLEMAHAYLNLGMVYLAQAHYAQSMEAYQEALTLLEGLGVKQDASSALVSVANLHALLGDHTRALTAAQRAVELASQSGNPDTLASAWFQEANIYYAVNQPVAAQHAFDEAVRAIEAIQRLSLAEPESRRDQTYPFTGMVSLLVAENKVPEAFSYSERAKQVILQTTLQPRAGSITRGMSPDEQQRERQIVLSLNSLEAQFAVESQRERPNQTRLAALEDRLGKARAELAAFERKLYVAHPTLGVLRGAGSPQPLRAIGALLLKASDAYAEYLVSDNKTYLFVLTSNRPSSARRPAKFGSSEETGPFELKAYTLPISGHDLADRIGRFREALANRNENIGPLARELYDILLKPAEQQLAGKKSLMIVPDKELWELPFQALQPRENSYLIETKAISYAPSLSMLYEMIRQHDRRPGNSVSSPKLIAFAVDSPSPASLAYIRATGIGNSFNSTSQEAKEVNRIGEEFKASERKIYTGAEATKAQAKKVIGPCRFLHIAAPGLLDNASPMYSVIAFAQSAESGDDEILRPSDVMNLDASAEMVVLPATSQTRPSVGPGAGIRGMSWSWFVAGSASTLLARWNVEGAESIELLVAFYMKVNATPPRKDTDQSKSTALREAIIKLLQTNRYRHPYYWAGFTLVGDPR